MTANPAAPDRAVAPWRGLRSPAAWTCPNCHAAGEPDPIDPSAIRIDHRPDCRRRTGTEVIATSETGSTSR